MVKPDWKDAPEWAQWVAMDADGVWFWYEEKPKFGRSDWYDVSGRMQSCMDCKLDPIETLEARPNDQA